MFCFTIVARRGYGARPHHPADHVGSQLGDGLRRDGLLGCGLLSGGLLSGGLLSGGLLSGGLH